jgi:hypothetical protein
MTPPTYLRNWQPATGDLSGRTEFTAQHQLLRGTVRTGKLQ